MEVYSELDAQGMLCDLIMGAVPAAVTPGRLGERLSQGCVHRGARPATRRERRTPAWPARPRPWPGVRARLRRSLRRLREPRRLGHACGARMLRGRARR
jgi:hypothetical protein